MKKQVLVLGASLLSIISSAQLQNGDLENWSDTLISENVDDWGKMGTVTKSTDAQHLATSIKLETTIDEYGDTNRALIQWGTLGQLSALTGLVGKPDSLIYWTKYNLQPTDTALSIIVPNDIFGMSFIEFSGVQNTWQRRAVAIDSTVDSLQIMFNTGHILDGTPGLPGSWIMLDNIQIKTTTGGTFTPTNNSFENWTSITVEHPNNWQTPDLFLAPLGIADTTVFKTTDAYANTYAAELKTISTIYGSFGGGLFATYTSTMKPISLDFYYKFFPFGTDTAHVEVYFYSAGTEVGSGNYAITNDTVNYTALSVPITYTSSAVIDSLDIGIYSGENVGTRLLVDQIKFTGGNTGVDKISLNNLVQHFPNPVNNKLTVSYELDNKINNATISIYNMKGQLIKTENLITTSGKNIKTINTTALPKGIYSFTLNLENKLITKKFIKQ